MLQDGALSSGQSFFARSRWLAMAIASCKLRLLQHSWRIPPIDVDRTQQVSAHRGVLATRNCATVPGKRSAAVVISVELKATVKVHEQLLDRGALGGLTATKNVFPLPSGLMAAPGHAKPACCSQLRTSPPAIRRLPAGEGCIRVGPMVHAVRDHVSDAAAVRFFSRWVIQVINPTFHPSRLVWRRIGPEQPDRLWRSPTEPSCHNCLPTKIVACAAANRLAGHEVGPYFDVADQMQQRSPRRAMTDVKRKVKLLVGQLQTTLQQFSRRPGVVPQQSIQQVHRHVPLTWFFFDVLFRPIGRGEALLQFCHRASPCQICRDLAANEPP